jgi:hypothetical protein
MKQTAVEWFMKQIGEKQPNGLYVIDTLEDVKNVFEQAKAMEKEQLLDMGNQFAIIGEDSPEQYFNETYG